ncbi:hypothetical protein L3X38_031731 [Prunus dulcis]|uniref:Uncharacterized protein n=1 Tax=Prunus dulcis TaxID=3755 RepID=A0AAD4YVF0_PRUDU|nr:hypothetical protein L3X38_031731 [Prunus dulcis]
MLSYVAAGQALPDQRSPPRAEAKGGRQKPSDEMDWCPAPRKCVFLRHGRRRGCLGASRFDAGSARPWKCVFLRHGRRRGCLGASRFGAGTARFIMV